MPRNRSFTRAIDEAENVGVRNVHARAAMRFALLLFAACGASRPPPPSAPPIDPRVVADAQRLANQGCACADDRCLNENHDALDVLERDHGGLDELPREVYDAHAKLDRCWRDRTKDVARDVELATKQLCTCHDTECARLAVLEIGRVEDKYKSDPIPPEAEARVIAAKKELETCTSEKIGDGRAIVPKIEALANEACACKSTGCVEGAMKRYGTVLDGILIIQHSGDTESRMKNAQTSLCRCTAKVGIGSIFPNASIDVSCTLK